jgi:predicted Zn-dependent peptidase
MSSILLACAVAGTTFLQTPLHPDTVLAVPGGPQIVQMRTPGSPVVSLRLSVRLAEGPTESGSAHLLQSTATERVQSLVQRTGARFETRRTGYGISYSVTGPQEEFEYLAWILREVVAQPRPEPLQLDRAKASAQAMLARESESPRAYLQEALRHLVTPMRTPTRGTPLTLARATGASLRAFWSRTHRPEALTVVAVGDLPLEALLAAFQGMGAPTGEAGSPAESPAPIDDPQAGVVRPRTVRSWYGAAQAVGPVADPHALVTAHLLADELQSIQGPVELEVELWDEGGVAVLALIGSASPGEAHRLVDGVRRALTGTEEGWDEHTISAAVAEARLGLLLEARSPAGLAEVVGRHLDATGAASGAARYAGALTMVTPESMADFLAAMGESHSFRLEGGR